MHLLPLLTHRCTVETWLHGYQWPLSTLLACGYCECLLHIMDAPLMFRLNLATQRPQVRDAVITMLDDWVGERGRVPLERLAPAVHDTAVMPKMSPEGRIAALTWLGGALATEQVCLCSRE